MTNELTMPLSGRGLAQIRDAAILSYEYRWYNTIHQAIGIYMRWVILGLEFEYQALGSINRLDYKITHGCIYTQENTVPGTHTSK